jgi:hypothetical protein
LIVDGIFNDKEIKIAKLIKNAKFISNKITMVVRYIHGEYDSISIESRAHPDDVEMLDSKIKEIERIFIELCESNKKVK